MTFVPSSPISAQGHRSNRRRWKAVCAAGLGCLLMAGLPVAVEAQVAPNGKPATETAVADATAAPSAPRATTGPIIDNVGCTANSLARNDDGSSGRVTLPFVVRLYNRAYTGLYVNNNGNVTFRTPLSAYTPGSINVADRPIIAPFWADVDTRPASSSVVQYGTTTFGGRQAFCVNWNGVGYYYEHTDKTNAFQLVLVKKAGVGNFDVYFNYGRVQWETGDASGGSNGFGGSSARAGISNGFGSTYELPGSAVHGAFLDSNPTGLIHRTLGSSTPGRIKFKVRAGVPQTP